MTKKHNQSTGTRRLFAQRLLCGAGIVAVAPVMASSARAQHITTNPTPDAEAKDQDAARLAALNDASRHLTIAVMIEDQGPFHFVVDTGAENSVISDRLAQVLNLSTGPSVTIVGIAKSITALTAKLSKLSFGPFVHTDLVVPILPQSALAADGYLGLDVISGRRVTFDFQNHSLKIEQPKSHFLFTNGSRVETIRAEPSSETYLKASGHDAHLRIIDCVVEDVQASAFIDTGAEVSIGNPSLMAALLAKDHEYRETLPMVLTGVTGGELIGKVIRISRIRIQELVFSLGGLAIADVPDFAIWKLHDKPALLIGMDYLRQFASVSIDYRAKDIRFELSLAPPMPSPRISLAG